MKQLNLSAPDRVDPAKVPQRILRGGDKMPALGIGTFGSDRFSNEDIAAAVAGAIEVGYRLVDCASVYGNEDLIGESFAAALASGISRDELFITGKVWNDQHGRGDVLAACAKTLRDLKQDYLDLYFIHWPFPNFHPKGAPPDYHNPNARPYIHEAYMETWYQMEQLVHKGYVKHIGVSNMTVAKMQLLLRDCRIMPSAIEMELHPSFQQTEFFNYCQSNNIRPIGFSPIGSPTRPDRDMTADDVVDIADPIVVKIAQDHQVHPALVCLKWAVQRGQTPIPFAVDRQFYLSNLRSVTEDPLTDAELEAMKEVNKNCRLIKGQVFLWEGQTDWRVLWDEDGIIRA